MVARVRRLPLLALGLLLACSPAGSGNSASATTGPALTGTGDGPTGGSTGDACLGSGECDTEAICVADYEAADTMPPGGMRGPASCVAPVDCVGATDLSRWCFDHQGCCDDLRCRPADGICEPPLLGQTTGGTDSSGEPTTGATTVGTTADDTGATGTGATSTGATSTGTTDTTSTTGPGDTTTGTSTTDSGTTA